MKPNFLFFLPDQHRPDWLGVNKSLPLKTPNLDRLAKQGIRFTNAYCPSPLCAPSRASLASGKRYEECGCPDNKCNYPLDQATYYQSLRDAGYRVAGVGKFDLHKDTSDSRNLYWGLDGSHLLNEWGFTEGIDNEGKIDGSSSYRVNGKPRGPYMKYLQDHNLADGYVEEHANMNKCPGNAYTTILPEHAYCDNWVAENGLQFLREFPDNQPWHLVVNFTGPHNPMDVTESMRNRWKDVDFPEPDCCDLSERQGWLTGRQNYAAMIENIDYQVGRFIELVAERGELDNTIIIYSSDHGEMLDDHNLRGKCVWYTPSAGIPMIIAGPGICQDIVSDALVSLHDLTATFLDYADAEPLPDMDSRSMKDLLESGGDSFRSVVTCALKDWKLIYDGRYKLIMYDDGRKMLYDLCNDPKEAVNIIDENMDIAERLMRVSGK